MRKMSENVEQELENIGKLKEKFWKFQEFIAIIERQARCFPVPGKRSETDERGKGRRVLQTLQG